MAYIKVNNDRVDVVVFKDSKIEGFIKVDEIPDPLQKEGFEPIMFYRNGKIEYEYEPVVTIHSSDDEEDLEKAKSIKIAEIIAYDQSNNVNGFVYNGETLWLKKEERLAVKDRFEREMARGVKFTTLYANGQPFPISPAEGIALLDAISEYADKCFDQTEMHKAAVRNLATIEEVEAYDYTAGYPNKLSL